MKMTKRKLAAIVAGIVLILAAGTAGVYLLRRTGGGKGGGSHAPAKIENPHYMLLDKVLVSVPSGRDPDGSAAGPYRVCSGDFAFDVGRDDAQLETRKPLLRGLIVHFLSIHTYDEIQRMPIDRLQGEIRKQLLDTLALQGVKQPFESVIVTQFLCE